MTVVNTPSGLEAANLACSETFDLIMLDMVLPDVDALAVIKKFAMESKTAAIPIVAIAPTKWIASALSDIPVAGVIQKPIEESVLADIIRGIFPTLKITQPVTILVYDETGESGQIVVDCLSSMGLRSEYASNEIEALRVMVNRPIRAAIVVLRSGLAKNRSILQRLAMVKPPVPVIAITNRLEPLEVKTLSECGVHEILVQPFTNSRLVRAVKDILTSSEHAAVVNTKRVLLIEDAMLAAKMMGSLLEHAGYNVTHAANAESALQLIRKDRPEFLLLDVILPGMDGVEFIHQIQQSNLHIPFVVVTGTNDPQRVSRLNSLGALRVFEKPIHSDELLGFMDHFFANLEP